MRHLAESGNPPARIMEPINAQHSKRFAPIRLRATRFSSVLSAVARATPLSHGDERRARAATLGQTVLAGISGEIIPRTFSTPNADHQASC